MIVKTMARHLIPPDGKVAAIAPSLLAPDGQTKTEEPNFSINKPSQEQPAPKDITETNGASNPRGNETLNPSVIPAVKLQELHHTFLIRNPRLSIPSVYRLSTPEMSSITGWKEFSTADTGYRELRLLFDFLKSIGQIGPKAAEDKCDVNNEEHSTGIEENVNICLIDADDLLDSPEKVMQSYCTSVGLSYDPVMLSWDNSESRQKAIAKFERFPGFHNEAMNSSSLKPREDVCPSFFYLLFSSFVSPLLSHSEISKSKSLRS